MYSLWATSAPLLTVALLAFADLGSSDVINLTSKTFEASIAVEPIMLIQFTVPWCFYCKELAPHYEEAATALMGKNIKLANVNCNKEVDLCMRKDIQHYPALKIYKNGIPTNYTGPRKADGIVSYMIKQAPPTVSEVTPANHEDFIKSGTIVVVAYLPSHDSEPAHVFSIVAEYYRDRYVFGLSTDPANAEVANITPPALVVYRTFDEPLIKFPHPVSDFGIEEIGTWLTELSTPAIDQIDGQSYTYVHNGKPVAYLFLDPTSEDNGKLLEALWPIARKFRHRVHFFWMDGPKFRHRARALSLPEVKWPAFVINDLCSQHKYPVDQSNEIIPELVSLWMEQFVKGELVPWFKSAPIPESQDESVYVVVGKSFEEVVFDDSKDVFIEFYSASQCDHCERMEQAWNSLGDKFAPFRDKIMIAKMDATRNELPPRVPLRLSGFPTLMFKPAGSRDFIEHKGDRSLESLIAFVEEHARNSRTANDADAAQAPMSIPQL